MARSALDLPEEVLGVYPDVVWRLRGITRRWVGADYSGRRVILLVAVAVRLPSSPYRMRILLRWGCRLWTTPSGCCKVLCMAHRPQASRHRSHQRRNRLGCYQPRRLRKMQCSILEFGEALPAHVWRYRKRQLWRLQVRLGLAL